MKQSSARFYAGSEVVAKVTTYETEKPCERNVHLRQEPKKKAPSSFEGGA